MPPNARPGNPVSGGQTMDLDTWLAKVGFEFHPFEHVAADDTPDGDPYLPRYFVNFPYYDEIKRPGTIFLFTRRGCGKSANRLMLEAACSDTLTSPTGEPRILGVRYTDFYPLLADYSGKHPTLEQHVEAILQVAVPRLFDAAVRYLPGALSDLDRFDREDLIGFLTKYSDCLTERGLHRQLERLGLPSSARQQITWQALKDGALAIVDLIGGGAGTAIHKALGALGQLAKGSTSLPDNLPKVKSPASPMQLVARFTKLARAMGIAHVYVFVDRTDELAQSADRPEVIADLLRPLVMHVPLLAEMSFKFFLPSEIDLPRLLGPGFRTDRFSLRYVEWGKQDLFRILEGRLEGASQGHVQSFNALVHFSDPTRPWDVDAMLVQLAHGSPRDMIYLGKQIFADHCRFPTPDLTISEQAVRDSMHRFARMRAEQLYNPGDLKTLQQIGWGSFVEKEAVERLHDYPRKIQEFVQDWEDGGLIVRMAAPATLWRNGRSHGLADSEVKVALRRWQKRGWITMGGKNNTNPKDTLEVFVIPDPRVRYLVNPGEMKGGDLE